MKRHESTDKRVRRVIATILVLAVGLVWLLGYMCIKDIPFTPSGLIMLFHMKDDDKRAKSIDAEKYDIKYDPARYTQIEICNQSILWCANQTLKCTDKYGNERWSMPINVVKPLLKTNGDIILVADIGSNSLFAVKDKQKIWEKTLDGKIIGADINKEGDISIIYNAKGTTTAVVVFDCYGNEKFTIGKSEQHMISAKISPTGKSMCISSIDTSGVSVNSILEFVDNFGKLLASFAPAEHAIFPLITYVNNEDVIAVGDSAVVSFSKAKKIKWQRHLDSRILSSGVARNKYLVTVEYKENNINNLTNYDSNIVIYNNRNGSIHASCQINDIARELECSSDLVVANCGTVLYVVDLGGSLLTKYTSIKDIIRVRFFDKNELLVVTKGSIRIVKISY